MHARGVCARGAVTMELFKLYGYDCMFGGIDYLGVYAYTQSPMHALTHMHSLIRPLHVYSHEFTHMHSHTHSFFTHQRARAHTHRAAAAGDDRADGCHFIL